MPIERRSTVIGRSDASSTAAITCSWGDFAAARPRGVLPGLDVREAGAKRAGANELRATQDPRGLARRRVDPRLEDLTGGSPPVRRVPGSDTTGGWYVPSPGRMARSRAVRSIRLVASPCGFARSSGFASRISVSSVRSLASRSLVRTWRLRQSGHHGLVNPRSLPAGTVHQLPGRVAHDFRDPSVVLLLGGFASWGYFAPWVVSTAPRHRTHCARPGCSRCAAIVRPPSLRRAARLAFEVSQRGMNPARKRPTRPVLQNSATLPQKRSPRRQAGSRFPRSAQSGAGPPVELG